MLKQPNHSVRPLDRPHFSYLQALLLAFYSNLVYQDAAKRWRGFAWPYLFLFATLLSIPFAPKMVGNAYHRIVSQTVDTFSALPPLVFKHGELVFNEPMPYLVRNAQQQVLAIIDTSGPIKWQDLQHYPQLMFVLDKHQWHYRLSLPDSVLPAGKNRFNKQWIAQNFSAQLSGAWLPSTALSSRYLLCFKWLMVFLVYPMVWLFFVTQVTLGACLLASLGKLSARVILKHTLTFRASFRIVLLAATPPLFVLIGLVALQQFEPGCEWLLITLLTIYYTMAVISLKHSSRVLIRS